MTFSGSGCAQGGRSLEGGARGAAGAAERHRSPPSRAQALWADACQSAGQPGSQQRGDSRTAVW